MQNIDKKEKKEQIVCVHGGDECVKFGIRPNLYLKS